MTMAREVNPLNARAVATITKHGHSPTETPAYERNDCSLRTGESPCQVMPKRREPKRTHEIERPFRGRKIGGDRRLSAPDRRLPEAPLPAHHPADAVQLSRRYTWQVARHQVSLHSTLPLRFPGESRRRV